MEIKYTDHAVVRMFQRQITPFMVRQMIDDPDGKIKQSKDKWIFYKNFKKRSDNKIAAVTVEKGNDFYEVITVMVNFEVNL